MGLKESITPLIITFNEQDNLERVLRKLAWAPRIVVVDSGSTDRTLRIIEQYAQAEVFERPFDSFANQCNYGLSLVESPWVLSIDADYELADALVDEIGGLEPPSELSGYTARFIYRVYGRPLRSTLYPPRTVLYRPECGRYRDEGHGHRLVLTGSCQMLASPIYHDDRKSLERWFGSQKRYAESEAAHLLSAPTAELSLIDRLRRRGWPAPALMVFYLLIVRGMLLDGWAGWFYVMQRVTVELMIAIQIVDRRLRNRHLP